MDISLINAGLAGGVALASVPVILHLFMKQTPKRVIFPALRLIRERHKRSKKKLRIKNWLLLLARMALVALMALALARPRLFSQTSLGDQEVPSAVGLVFDTSLSMGYKPRDKTLLDEAKERAHDLLKKLPTASQVFVIDSADPIVPPALSPTAARKRVDGLVIRPANRPLNGALGQAYAAVADCDRPRHEVFVLTDLARSSWDRDQPVEGLAKAKKKKPDIVTYVLRMAPSDVRDAAVMDAAPSVPIANPGEPVEIRARFSAQGPATTRMAEFYVDGILRDMKPVAFKTNGDTELKFMTPKLDPAVPVHRGVVKLGGAPDPLTFDDARGFTFKVQPVMKVLVISDQARDSSFVTHALDPDPTALPPGAPRPCRVESIRTPKFADIARERLSDYVGIFLLNVKELTETDWNRLNVYVHDGGGLVVGLGHLCNPDNYNANTASQLLPASLEKPSERAETAFGKVADATHPLFRLYTRPLEADLSRTPVYRHWLVTQPKGSRTLLSFADAAPALIERSFQGGKTGRVLLWTTPLSRRGEDLSEAAWNEFPNPRFWSFWFIMKQTVPYLAGSSSEQLNFEVGQDVILPIDPTKRFNNYTVASEDGKSLQRLTPPVTNDSLVIVAPTLGQWTVTASGPSGETGTMGFSVNPPVSEMGYVALEPRELDVLFGKGGYSLAVDAVSLKKAVKDVRVGSELFPWIMFLILIVVTLENLLANKFHREGTPRPALAPAA